MSTLSKQLRLHIVVLISVLLGSLTPVAVQGQDVTVERSGSIDTGIGDPVTWQSPWESAAEQPIAPDPDVAVVMIRYDQRFAFVAQGTIADPAALREAMHERVRELQGAAGAAAVSDPVTVDSSVADPVSYWLDLMAVDGAAYGSFALARTGAEVDVLTVFIGPVGEFAEGVADAQAGLRVGDSSVFDGVEGGGLQALLEENLSALPPASPVAPDDVATEAPDDAAEEDIPFAEVGMVGPRSYVSPQFGVAIEWTSDWDLDYTFGDPVLSDRKLEQDQLYLLWNEEVDAWMVIFIWPNFEASMGEFVDYAASPQGTLETYGEGASVAMSGASPTLGAVVTLLDEGFADPALIYSEFHVSADGGAIIEVRLISIDPAITEAAIDAAQDDLTVEGEPVLVFYPPADVAAVHDDVESEPVLRPRVGVVHHSRRS